MCINERLVARAAELNYRVYKFPVFLRPREGGERIPPRLFYIASDGGEDFITGRVGRGGTPQGPDVCECERLYVCV